MENLNEQLTPNDSPIALNQGATPSYLFDAMFERNAVSLSKIKNFSFSAGTGGTLTLGGTNNGNGLFQLKDVNGTKIIQGDNQGHHYYGTLSTTEQIRMDALGFHAYGTAGTSNEQIKIDNTGFYAYDNGSLRTRITSGYLDLFGTAGSIQQLSNGMFFSNAPIIIGSSPGYISGGTPTLNIYNISGGIDITGFGGNIDISAYNKQVLFGGDNYSLLGHTSGSVLITASGTHGIWVGNGSNAFYVNGVSKSAIVPSSKGYKTLYTNESPDVWFMDFCESKDKIDPLFLEVTSPPYHFIKCEGGEYQVWGKRKGFENIRFEDKTKEQFEKNNNFWNLEK